MSIQAFRPQIVLGALSAVTIFLSACKQGGAPTSSPAPVPAPVLESAGGGGVDGSGGNTQQSSLAEVRAAFHETLKLLPERLKQISSNLHSDSFSYDLQYGHGSHLLVTSFIGDPRNIETASLMKDGLENGKIQITDQEAPCQAGHGFHDGSAVGNLDQGKICISLGELRKVSPKILQEEVFLLIIHELSHLKGFDEEKAVRLQKLLSLQPGIYTEGNKDPFFPNGLKKCKYDDLAKEIKMMEASPYWQAQKEHLIEILSGVQSRSCFGRTRDETKLLIFVDDAEYIYHTRQFVQPPWPIQTPRARGTKGTYLKTNNIQDLTDVASLRIETENEILFGVDAKFGSEAQCSPKALLANVIANVPDALDNPCGSNDGANSKERVEARIKKQKEILEGEK